MFAVRLSGEQLRVLPEHPADYGIDDPEVAAFEDWLARGASFGHDEAPELLPVDIAFERGVPGRDPGFIGVPREA